MKESNNKYGIIGINALVSVALVSLFYLFPKAGDDYFFDACQNVQSFFETQKNLFATENGRIIGNALVYAFVDYPLLAGVFNTVIVMFIIRNIQLLFKSRSIALYGICIGMCILLPKGIYAQTYAWRAGFYNYVPPTLFILISIRLLLKLYFAEEVNMREKLLLLFSGFFGCFFMENCTTFLCFLAVAMLVSYFVKERKCCVWMIAYLFATVAGAIVMFASPVYRRIADNEDVYRKMTFSISGILRQIRENYGLFSTLTIAGNMILFISLSVVCGVIIFKYKKRLLRNVSVMVLTAVPIYYYLSRNVLTPNYSIDSSMIAFLFDLVLSLTYFATIFFCIWNGVEEKKIRWTGIVLLCSVLVLNGPLLIVTPIGPRCFYASYILLVALIMLLLGDDMQNRKNLLYVLRYPVCVCVCAILMTYLFIAWKQHKVYVERNAYLEQEIKNRRTKIVVPRYQYPSYIHEPETSKIGYDYFLNESYDIEFEYVDYWVWKNEYESVK